MLVYDTVLSAGDVEVLYGGRAPSTRGRRTSGDAYPRRDNLVAGYRFDEGKGTTIRDFSGHGNDGTLHGGLTWVSGRGGAAAAHAGALQFDGTRYATLPQSTRFTAGDFTVSVWFNPTSADRWLFMRGFVNRDQPGDIGLGINAERGNVDFEVRTADNRWLFGWGVPPSVFHCPFKLNQWNHVVVTRRGDTYAMWMNGAKVGSQVATADISDAGNTNPFIVGGSMSDGGVIQKFQGALDELRIFHRCLSDAEIAALDDGDGGGGSVLDSAAVPETTPATPGVPNALHFDHGHVDLGGKQLTTGATSIALWYRYEGYTHQFPMLVDLKAGQARACSWRSIATAIRATASRS